ncbi:CLF1 [Candida theae]|uniref:Pre-mRNA-splicing factor CLF1 n=1 Tax=Candida theae TaxID=1198502 RepID=A0AAD5FYS1_9ASCO|nr:CLF1 [Candida theae]KAI5958379.1 CLF1 [Candida theae]
MESNRQLIFEDTTTKLARPKQTIQDLEELHLYQQTKRKEFEQQLNKNRLNNGQWLRYARWELDHNHDFARARSIMERALDVNIEHVPFWTQYIQFELIHKNVNHARNLLERATSVLPKVNKLWFLYVQTEEMLKNYSMVRQIFERWLTWHPDQSAWDAYIHFESRYDEVGNVRNLFQRYLLEYPSGTVWLKWVNYELHHNRKDVEHIRAVFESAVDSLVEKIDETLPEIVAEWLIWEVECIEYDRVMGIRKLLTDESKFGFATSLRYALYNAISETEKLVGNKIPIEESILLTRKLKYKQDVEDDGTNFDSWWSYIDIIEHSRDMTQIRKAFESACLNTPQDAYKSDKWKQFIMLWIRFAFWEEFDNGDIDAARKVWNECLAVIPHKNFTAGKVWIGLAEFELRNNPEDGLTIFRKVMGRALGQMNYIGPKRNILKHYIATERKLGEWDRVRQLFQKWLEFALVFGQPCNEIVKEYLEFEKFLGETARCESLLQIVTGMAKNEVIAQSFDQNEMFSLAVSFYAEEMNYGEIRKLYRDLVSGKPTTDNWISFALFESTIPTAEQLERFLSSNDTMLEVEVGDEQTENTRAVFDEAVTYFKKVNDIEGRKTVLEAWNQYELVNGNEQSVAAVSQKLPKRVKKRRTVDGIEEEYYEWEFPNDTDPEPSSQPKPSVNKFLENARKWAQSKQ